MPFNRIKEEEAITEILPDLVDSKRVEAGSYTKPNRQHRLLLAPVKHQRRKRPESKSYVVVSKKCFGGTTIMLLSNPNHLPPRLCHQLMTRRTRVHAISS